MKAICISALLLLPLMMAWTVGCGDDDEEEDTDQLALQTPVPDTTPPRITQTEPKDGEQIREATLRIIFSERVDEDALLNGLSIEPAPRVPKDRWTHAWFGRELTIKLGETDQGEPALASDVEYTLRVPKDAVRDKAGNTMEEDLVIQFRLFLFTVVDIDPSGQLGPGDPHAKGHVNNADNQFGGIYIVKEPDERWHVVGAGLLPWGGTQVEMLAKAINRNRTPGRMSPKGVYVEDGDDADNEVFDSPEGGQIDWIQIKDDTVEWLTWYNGTGAWDGVWFKAEGDFVLFEHLGMNNENLGGADSACPDFGDRGCLLADLLPPAPPNRIWIGGAGGPETRANAPHSTPFALNNR